MVLLAAAELCSKMLLITAHFGVIRSFFYGVWYIPVLEFFLGSKVVDNVKC